MKTALMPGDCIKMARPEPVAGQSVQHLVIQFITAQMAMHTARCVER